MDMEISDSSDKCLNRGRRNASRLRILSSSSGEDFVDVNSNAMKCFSGEDYVSELENEDNNEEWQEIKGRTSLVNKYSEEEKFLREDTDCNDPFALYKLFFTDYILEKIVEETNKYAAQCINNSLFISRTHQLPWKPVTKNELNTFIGILLIMGVMLSPDIRLYWSQKEMYTNLRIKNAIKRDRFLSILQYLHFSNNTTAKMIRLVKQNSRRY
ncbi:PREDICTED: piggyBac transposable element-derived protein 4-like [Polistes canadensis]|uniref:piggyBac transposable element-derived protein 4-like n=1 Tax=Polistes canadensis TaxID=91411 RepID=UPI000718B2DE|nr:PREDICTED: piggyBac transposable element-derived protein 4-like [Polistes canadensis]